MTWTLTNSLAEFEAAAGDRLRAAPARHTVPLTILTSLRERGPAAFGDDPAVFGWHQAAGVVDRVVLRTPPHPLLVAVLPAGPSATATALTGLIGLMTSGGRDLDLVNLPAPAQAAFLAAWAAATGGSGAARLRMRLYRLAGLLAPDPLPPGSARVAGDGDRDLLIRWHEEFGREDEAAGHEDASRVVDDRLTYGGLIVWELAGQAVAMAGSTREVAGVVRVSAVYTPPDQRRRGFGGAVTTAASQAALAAGATEVVLFTNLANPTSNALYQRLGYRPAEDRVLLAVGRPGRPVLDVTGSSPASSERA